MRMLRRSSPLGLGLGFALGIFAFLTSSVSAQTTTITGKVYSPAGPVNGYPIPNILVYVAQTAVLPFTQQGVVAGQSCSQQPNLVSGSPLVEALTAPDGSFTLTSPSIPSSATIVVQAGKWRQQYQNTPITVGGTTNLTLSMPSAQSATSTLPHIAVVTGSADAIECIFNQIGIANSEITDPTGKGSINLYEGGNGSGGAVVSAASPTEASLLESPSLLNSYDLVMFGCQGNANDPIAKNDTGNALENILAYTSSGGRIFTTHYEYVWLNNAKTFPGVANWIADQGTISETPEFAKGSGDGIATIDQTYAEGAVLATWLQGIGASYNNTLGQVELTNMREDETGAINPPAQSWATANSSTSFTGNPSMQFTFNTPLGTSGTPTVAIAFSNSTAVFQPGDTADTVTVDVTNNSTTAADSSLQLAVSLPSAITPVSLVDPTGGWTCTLASPTSTCTRTTSLAAGATDNVVLTFSIAATVTPGQESLTAALSGGGLSNTGQCGRVLYNDYHVETASSGFYPAECPTQTTLTNTQKFLEFSLYNLSNFVSPTTTDLIVIQGQPVITWATPSPVYYGTLLSSIQLDATATFNGTTVPGTFVYTPAAGSEPAVGNDTLSVIFTPTDTTDYFTTKASVVLQVMPDTTTTTLTNPNPTIFYGQIVADLSLESVASGGPASITEGVLNFYIDSVLSCTLPANVAATCPAPTGAGYNVGTHTIQSCYVDTTDNDFLGSCSPVYNVVVVPDPTSTVVTSSADPSTPNQNVIFTANIVDQYAIGAGTVNFYDGTLLLGSGVANAQGNATFSTSALIVGKHTITACLVASLDYNASVPCGTLVQLVTLVPTGPLATVTLLTSSANPSIFGQSVTFAASVATTGAFAQVPAGTLTFYDGSSILSTTTLDSSGNATFTTSTLAVGTHTITAAYTGTSAIATSTSLPLQQVVLTTLPSAGNGFLLTVTPSSVSIGVGSSTTVNVSVLSLNNYSQAVQLSCSGLPVESTCTFGQSLMPVGGGNTTLNLAVAAPHACGASTPYFVATNGVPPALPLLALIGLGMFFARRRRKLFRGLTLAFALCLVPMLNGCSSPCTDLGTQPSVYNVTVTGTSTGGTVTSQSVVVQMNVHL
jgi:uncharacterized protein (TIGR03382 family)